MRSCHTFNVNGCFFFYLLKGKAAFSPGIAAMAVGPILAIIFIPFVSAAMNVKKCCAQGYSLNSTDDVVHCSTTSHHWLYMNFTFGLPDCHYYVEKNIKENDLVSCIDNYLSSETVLALKCRKDFDPNEFKIPPVNYLRKCCPLSRPYDTIQQHCWSNRTDNFTHGLPLDLINVIIPGYDGVVDIRTGLPLCEDKEVLIDSVVPFNRIKRETSQSIAIQLMENSTEILINPDESCIDLTERNEMLVLRMCQPDMTVCNLTNGHQTCVRKCCPEGQSFINKTCTPSLEIIKPLQFYNITNDGNMVSVKNIRPAFVIGDPCPYGKYALNPEHDPKDDYYFDIYGYLHILGERIDKDSYCVEHIQVGELTNEEYKDGDYAFLCFGDEEIGAILNVPTVISMMISCFFFLITFVVYSCLPSLQNLHGKTLMCQVACLLIAYLSLLCVQNLEFLNTPCEIMAYWIEFTFLAAFCWLNVISFDIWWAFGSMQNSIGKKMRERRRFILYSIYAWGVATVITVASIVADHTEILDVDLRPMMGFESCFFSERHHGRVLFFSGPQLILFVMNVVFFTLTAIRCSKIKNELHNIAHSSLAEKRFQADKRKLVMNAKLFVVMGVTWLLEVVSTFGGPPEMWYASDVANALQGLLIFLIFVMKKRIFIEFRQRVLQLICRIEPKTHRPSTSTLCTISVDTRGSPSTIGAPHFLKKSKSDSKLAVLSTWSNNTPKHKLQQRCMSSISANRLQVNHHHNLWSKPG